MGGEVSIDTSPESDPEDTIRKAQMIRQAALAPAEPSGQDRRAAAAAAQMAMKARQEAVGESEDEGLPEVATPPSSPPIVRLDYGQGIQTGQLVDMFG